LRLADCGLGINLPPHSKKEAGARRSSPRLCG
jgi:hypothetical protein